MLKFIFINLYYIINNYICILLLISNYLYYIKNNKFSKSLLKYLYLYINNCGVIYIKLFQWIITKEDILNIGEDNLNLLKNIFQDIFENCKTHNYNYTKNILQKEFYHCLKNKNIKRNLKKTLSLDNEFLQERFIININPTSCGSIAQTYTGYYYNQDNSNIKLCIKIVHPYIKLQTFWSNLFIRFILKIYVFYYRKKQINFFSLPIDYNKLYLNFVNQCNMKNEYENILKFYYNFIDNEYVVIPKPIYSNDNILIMEYEEGEKLEKIKESEYTKNKILFLLILFNYESILFKNIFHCDLHQGNWKVRKYNNFFKLIIYDFGFCQSYDDCQNNDYIKKFLYLWLIKDYINIIESSINIFLIVDNNKKNTDKREIIFNYAKKNYIPFINSSINLSNLIFFLIKVSKKFNCKINYVPFNIFISFMLIENYLNKYGILDNQEKIHKLTDKNQYFNNIKSNIINAINICNEYDIFKEMNKFYQEFLNKYDSQFINNFKKMERKKILKNSNKIISI